MASTEASSEQAATHVGDAAGRDDISSPRIALSERLPRPWLFPLLVYGLTWALIFATWQVTDAIYGKGEPWTFFFMFKDANHYLDIARNGYPAVLHFPPKAHPVGYPPAELVSRKGTWWSWLLYKPRVTYHGPYPFLPAFFPLFPGLIWLLHWVAGGSFVGGALLAQVLSGAAAALLVWLLAVRVRGRWVADRAVIAFCVFPGAMTFGMLYSEPLAIAIGAATLLAMLNRRWVLAGLLAALGTAERPTLIVLTGVLAVGALVAIRQRREWRSLRRTGARPFAALPRGTPSHLRPPESRLRYPSDPGRSGGGADVVVRPPADEEGEQPRRRHDERPEHPLGQP